MMKGAASSGKKKHSRKRDEILALIRSTTSHPSARWVYERLKPAFPRLSLGTVYRNIRAFREEGELVSVGVVQGEERFDGQVRPHCHFICSRCGKIVDIDGGVDKNQEETAGAPPGPVSKSGLSPGIGDNSVLYVDHRKTVFYGLCGDCRRAVEEGDTTA
ncbi:MAG: transcriptional repressor [Treponema sp.]|jgi:Fur family peroxide stress response transcriptional regulator|nr:transcriptional repressor [Treponema sp.]